MAGLAVSTKQLTLRTWELFPAKTEFGVTNPTGEHVAIKLTAEGDGGQWLRFSEPNLVLAPDETKQVGVRVFARRGGTFHPVIAVRQQALEGAEVGIATGIRLPVEIQSRAEWGPLFGAALIVLIYCWMKRPKT